MKREITVCLMLPETLTCVAEQKNGEVRIVRVLRSIDPTVADINDASTEDNLDEIDNAWEAAACKS
jgi:hypothetical protein